jgi:cytochrome c-type biogenesis protein CcmF
MQYNGEHLLPGQLGHFLVILSLATSFIATISFFKANKATESLQQKSWLQLARASFLVETTSIFSIFGILYFLVANHYHEYFFAWNHSSRSLQTRYLLACIWEDQSGSFLLWSIWHCILGWIIIWKNKKWEAPVLTVINFAQFAIATMLLGIYFFGVKVGNEPFILWRNSMPDLPLFTNPDYLQLPRVFEGNDLNTLLQNYWMVIHPPILFLGFASTIIPFAFAYAGLMNKNHSWHTIALPWASFSAAILGTGIMMGAAWAYESLSFGGYWAWDPVENASLVPWIVMVAGLHTNMIYKSTGYSLRSTYFFYIISFVLVLYSTFLTRSGVLGDTSVHAFTIDDKNVVAFYTQLISFMLVFFIPAMYLFFKNYKSIPSIQREENSYSREFWMFIGSLVLFLSAIIIIAKTSTPVFNKVFNSNIAPPEDPEFAYNQIQIFIAIIIGILTAVTQYLKYKNTPALFFSKKIALPTLIALLISAAISIWGGIDFDKKGIGFLIAIHVAVFGAVYAVVANLSYVWLGLKGKVKAAGALVAHVGFGLVLLGILISSSKKTVLSWNTTGVTILKKQKNEDPAENITLFKKVTTDMGKYHVTYVSDTFNAFERKRFYELNFQSKDGKENFNLYPDVIKNNKGIEGFAANPSSKHYWDKDIFVYISSFIQNTGTDTTHFDNRTIKIGDTTFYSSGFMILHKVDVNPPALKNKFSSEENALFLDIEVIAKDGRKYKAYPGLALKDSSLRSMPDTVVAQSLVLNFNKVQNPASQKIELGVKESNAVADLVTLKVYEFPMINILWLGVVIMVIGFVMSILQRLRSKKITTA